MVEPVSVFCDGGVFGKNPSPDGGTWAWCHVGPAHEGVGARVGIRANGWGIVTPADVGLPTVTNNLTELLAALHCLEALPGGWAGALYTDSLVTLRRVLDPSRAKFKGIPDALRDRLRAARNRLGGFRLVLLGGHPTRAELAAGVRADGKPVSSWNVWCDETCGRLARKFAREKLEARYRKGGEA